MKLERSLHRLYTSFSLCREAIYRKFGKASLYPFDFAQQSSSRGRWHANQIDSPHRSGTDAAYRRFETAFGRTGRIHLRGETAIFVLPDLLRNPFDRRVIHARGSVPFTDRINEILGL